VSHRLRIDAHASTELTEAVRWYELQRPGLGAEFLDTVNDVLELIEQNPAIGSPLPRVASGRMRRMLVRRFPYHVVYEVTEDEILVVAVAHTRRRPDYWVGRI
jgi:plasmid stabilization system protein ParE